MKRIILTIIMLTILAFPVSAMDFKAPEAPGSVENYIPPVSNGFGEDLWYVLRSSFDYVIPAIKEASGACFSVIAVVIIQALMQNFTGNTKAVNDTVGVLSISLLLLQPANSLIQLGIETVTELSEYGKALLPVLTAAMAAQGGTATSAALYTATAIFDTVLTAIIAKAIVPMIYIYLVTCIANSALQEQSLKQFKSFSKWSITWSLKTVLYVFTGYMTITGVVNGTVDASTLKATKLTISGTVPVVGSILSDASESVLIGASLMKNSVGIYGVIAILSIFIGPFIKTGVHYMLLKFTSAVCSAVGTKTSAQLVQDFSDTMGFIMGMIGAVCIMLLISTICFMKGVS